MTKRQFKIPLAVLGLTLAIIAIALVGQNPESAQAVSTPSSNRPLPVETIQLQTADSFAVERSYTGRVVASRESQIGFQRVGRVTRVHYDLGDRVAQGAIVAELDTRRLEAQDAELAAQIAGAEAQLRLLVEGPRQEQIEAARANVERLKSQQEVQSRNLARRQQLYDRNVVSQEDLDQIAFSSRAAQAELDRALHQLNELVAGSRVDEVAAQRAIVQQLKAARDAVRVDIDESKITAPFTGIIADRVADEGTILSPNQPIVRIVESKYEAHIGLPLDVAASIELGQQFQLVSDTDSWTAKCRAKLPDLSREARAQTVVFDIDTELVDFSPVNGSLVRIAISRPQQGVGFVVPISALSRGQRGLWSIWVVEERKPEDAVVAARDVEVLYTDDDQAFVRGTVTSGERVVVSGGHRLAVGQAVILSEDVAAAKRNSPVESRTQP